MKQVHVECLPDEKLVIKLGHTRKFITHHQGKSRIFSTLRKNKNLIAIVDEDPGSIKTRYEESLKLRKEFEGIRYFTDTSGNIVLILKGKLEDWIIAACKKQKIDISKHGLPVKPNDLHDVIHHRLVNFGRLIDELILEKNPALLKLKSWIN
jgi:hypothetical protein